MKKLKSSVGCEGAGKHRQSRGPFGSEIMAFAAMALKALFVILLAVLILFSYLKAMAQPGYKHPLASSIAEHHVGKPDSICSSSAEIDSVISPAKLQRITTYSANYKILKNLSSCKGMIIDELTRTFLQMSRINLLDFPPQPDSIRGHLRYLTVRTGECYIRFIFDRKMRVLKHPVMRLRSIYDVEGRNLPNTPDNTDK
jgi:hypothetical protein